MVARPVDPPTFAPHSENVDLFATPSCQPKYRLAPAVTGARVQFEIVRISMFMGAQFRTASGDAAYRPSSDGGRGADDTPSAGGPSRRRAYSLTALALIALTTAQRRQSQERIEMTRYGRGSLLAASLAGLAVALLPSTANAQPAHSSDAMNTAKAAADCGYYFDGVTPTWGSCSGHPEQIDIHIYFAGQQGDATRCVQPGKTDLGKAVWPQGAPVYATKSKDRC